MSSAGENWSTTSVESSGGTVAPFPLWLEFWFEMIEPWILFFGILGNIFVVAIMPRPSVIVGPSMKIYYTSIGVADVINLVQYCFYTFFNDSLYAFKRGIVSLVS